MVEGTSAGSEIGRQLDQEHAVLEARPASSAATWRPRRVLPVPPGPVSVTSRAPSADQAAHLGQLALAPEQRGRVGRQVVRASVERGEGREVEPEVRGGDLEDVARARSGP